MLPYYMTVIPMLLIFIAIIYRLKKKDSVLLMLLTLSYERFCFELFEHLVTQLVFFF